MARKKEADQRIKKRSQGWEPTQQDLDTITNRLRHTGQEGITHIEREHYAEMCKKYREAYPDDDETSINYKYFPLIAHLRYVFRKYRIEFFAWISDPKWLFPVDRALDTFLKTGYLPEKYKSAEGQNGFFKFADNATIELVMMSRGTGKTTKWTCMRALHLVINYPTYKWLVVHSDKDRAKSLLKSIKEMMMNPYLELVFPDLFAEDAQLFKSRGGNILTNEKINIVTFNEETDEYLKTGDVNFEFRKEATFTVGSPQIDRTSWHFEGVLADDLVIDETSRSAKVTKQLISYFRSLFAMKQYRDDWTFRCYMTGTEWWQDSLYTVIKEMSNASVFEMPAEWEYNGQTERLCRYFTDSELEHQRAEQAEWFESQMLMKARPYEGGELNLGFSEDRNIMELTEDELAGLKAKHMIVQICDPSFSSKGKVEGDKRSRFSIIHAVVTEEVFLVYNAWQTFGMDTGGIKSVNLAFAKQENIDFFIQDAQGQQTGLYDDQLKMMKDEMPWLQDFKHTKAISGKKEEVANKVLSFLFEMREIYIVKIKDDKNEERRKNINKLINELFGVGGMDFVDCMVYMVSDIDRQVDIEVARRCKRLKSGKKRGFQQIQLRTGSLYGRLS